jgi:hypothetical protein
MTAFFGCWGDPFNPNVENAQYKKVLGKLRDDNDVRKVVVAGDNYYMQKQKKTKLFNELEIVSLFKDLSATKKDTTVMLGNHEWDKFNKTECSVIPAEQKVVQGLKNLKLVATQVKVIDGDLWVMLDTSMFEYGDLQQECYPTDIATVRAAQRNAVLHEIRSLPNYAQEVRRVFVVGHHPICIFRKKEAKEKEGETQEEQIILDINARLASFVFDILNICPQVEFHYLCADFHVYQKQALTINGIPLVMHIVGTGGAKLDVPYENVDANAPVVENRAQMATERPNVLFYSENGAAVDAKFDMKKGELVARDSAVFLKARLIESAATYGYLQISPRAIRFVEAVDRGGRKSRRRRKKRRASRK